MWLYGWVEEGITVVAGNQAGLTYLLDATYAVGVLMETYFDCDDPETTAVLRFLGPWVQANGEDYIRTGYGHLFAE
jgi:hypothetical protein